MTMMCDLPHDLVGEEILTKVPITSLKAIRSTCKIMERFVQRLYCCLVLCITKDKSKLLVWNPYLGQIKWIETPSKKRFRETNMYALGHNNDSKVPNYKILMLRGTNGYGRVFGSEIYDSTSDSWSVLDLLIPDDCELDHYQHGVDSEGTVRTNTTLGLGIFLLCFDYTKERFGHHLPLPLIADDKEAVVLSCVREDQLAVLYEKRESKELEIWITNKIASNAVVSWSKFLTVDTRNIPFVHHRTSSFRWDYGSFFIGEEKKVIVVFSDGLLSLSNLHLHATKASYILGEEGYIKSLKIGCSLHVKPSGICFQLVSSSYLPSLVQLDQPRKR
ncbi:hypothetical protein BRARA_K00064 [Brassica rapa]|uniref:F-box associated beta-propeller type 1 domain-containing protein n=1 Tax=Brassica campestris TaxID=3711 RepID=A0A397KYQ0_BRACM|nr:hypothetical protein BRARA_K00064 [Brassica rapa]